jgi:hypothetical protein
MLVVTVARKPLSGTVASTTLAHGTGALNIDGCRIATAAPKQATAGKRAGKWGVGEGDCTYEKGTGAEFTNEGRWPANLILQHQPGCKQTGTRKVRWAAATFKNVEEGAKRTGWIGPIPNQRLGVFGYTDEDGMEEVPVWECMPGCAVAGLDDQTGYLHSRGNRGPTYSGGGSSPTGWFLERVEVEGSAYDQGGGASRFFKQVRGEE